MKVLTAVLLSVTAVSAEDFEPKPERSKFEMKSLREFVNFGLSIPRSQGSLRKLGEPTRTVHGRVVDHQGKPIVGAAVSFATEIGYSNYSYDENFDMTDEQGRFVVEGDFTRVRIAIWCSRAQAWHQQVDHDQSKVEIRWPKPASCAITFDASLLKDESHGGKAWLTTTHYAVGMASLDRSVEIKSDGPTVVDKLLPGEYSVQLERILTLDSDPVDSRAFRVEVARFKVAAGEQATARAAYMGRRSLSGTLKLPAPKPTQAGGKKPVLKTTLPKSMFVEVVEQKRSYEHVPQVMDAFVIGEGHRFSTRPLPAGRYLLSFEGPRPKGDPKELGGLGFGWQPPTSRKWTYRVVVPEEDKRIVMQLPPADSIERRIQMALDSEGSRNISWSYIDVQAAQVGRETNATQTVLRMLEDRNTPNSWQYPLTKSLAMKLGDAEVVREIIRIAMATKDVKLRGTLVNQGLRMSKILREEIADAVEPLRKDQRFRVRHLGYTTMCVHVTDKNRERVVPWMIEGLSDPYPRTRYDMAAWLGRIKAKEAVVELSRVSRDDPSGAVRVTAAHALAQITGDRKRAVQVMTVRLRGETYCGQWEAAHLLAEYKNLPEITIKTLLSKVKKVKGPYNTIEKLQDNRLSRSATLTLKKVAPTRVPKKSR